jgi:DNA-binding MarR family transcriptional regulator
LHNTTVEWYNTVKVMKMQDNAKEFREIMRQIERKLGIAEDDKRSCCGITLGQCHTLVEAGRAGKASLVELAEIMDLDKSTVSRSVDQLVRKGYMKREADKENRRYVAITLTKKGREKFEGIESSMNSLFEELLGCIPEDKRLQVIESAGLILGAIRTVEKTAARTGRRACPDITT